MPRFFFIIAIFFLVACSNNNEPDNPLTSSTKPGTTKSYPDMVRDNAILKPKSDTIALNFVLGQTKSEVEQHFNQLVQQGKIEPKTSWEFTVSDVKFSYYGHPYELFLSDTSSCQTIITSSYYNDQLATLTFFGTTHKSIDELHQFMEKKFGKNHLAVADSSGSRPRLTYYWFDGYKQVSLEESPFVSFAIKYTDLRFEAAKQMELEKQDSAEIIIRKQKAESSVNDFR